MTRTRGFGSDSAARLVVEADGTSLNGEILEREVENLAVEDNQLSFELTFERDGNSFTVAYKGTPRGDSMKGTMESEFNGESRKTDETD